MRLGQLAKQYNLKTKELTELIKSKGHVLHSEHPNAKASDEIVSLLDDHFGSNEEEIDSQEVEETSTEVEINTVQEPAEIIPDLEPVTVTDKSNHEDTQEIDSAQLLEMLEAEESNLNLEQITLIKAPKKHLDGLKVVGKIDLPEPKPKPTKEELEAKKQERDRRRGRKPPLSEEEKEKRRLRAKRKKEEYEERKAKRQKQAEIKRLKARKEAHYKGKVEKSTEVTSKRKNVKKTPSASSPVRNQKNENQRPKSVLGRFWNWLVHPE